MKYVEFPKDGQFCELVTGEGKLRPLPFYLAAEEHLARNYPRDDYFFMWQVEPTVIFGRCQNPFTEVKLDLCAEKGISFYRRKSGGGAVYADRDNIMMSYITPCREVEETFGEYCRTMAGMLGMLIPGVTANGRNDILIGDRKVSGNACYSVNGMGIMHGTMLFDTDRELMQSILTPPAEKLRRNGVASVASRVTTLREHLPALTIGEFHDHCRRRVCDSTLRLDATDIAEIERIALPYYSESWIKGRYKNENMKN